MHANCMQSVEALTSLCICAGSLEPSLLDNSIIPKTLVNSKALYV